MFHITIESNKIFKNLLSILVLLDRIHSRTWPHLAKSYINLMSKMWHFVFILNGVVSRKSFAL